MMLKIIWCDGYARESVADRLVCENISSQTEAEIILNALRDALKGDESQWYRIVLQDKELWRGMEELI